MVLERAVVPRADRVRPGYRPTVRRPLRADKPVRRLLQRLWGVCQPTKERTRTAVYVRSKHGHWQIHVLIHVRSKLGH